MKHWRNCFILCLLISLMTGCSRQQTYIRQMEEADSLMEQHPDSALHLLEDIADVIDNGNEGSRAYYTLLLTQARYKCYEPAPSDSLINTSVAYYEKNGSKSLLCRAYYYRAMTLYEQGKHKEALQVLKKGEDLAVRNHNLPYMAKYHESLCMVNDHAKYYDLMLKYAKLALMDNRQLNDTSAIARNLSQISTASYRLGKQKESKDYIQETMALLHQINPMTKAYILSNIGCSMHSEGDLESAMNYLKEALIIHPMSHTFAELGDVYADEGNMAEAERCWQEALKTDDSQTVVNVLSSMRERYEQQQDYKSAFAMSERIYQIKDSLTQASEQAAIAEIQHKYDRQVVENKYYKTLTWLFGSFLLLIIISIGYYYYHQKTVRRYVSQLSAKEEAIRDAQRRIAMLKDLDGEHSGEIVALQKQIATLQKQTYEQLGRGREIYQKIAAGGKLSSTDNEHYLIDYYSILRYEAYHSWMGSYKDLSARLLTYLILKDMEKSDVEIQETLSITNSSLRSLKTRLKSRLRHP